MSDIKTVDDLISWLYAQIETCSRKEACSGVDYLSKIISFGDALDKAKELRASMEISFRQFIWEQQCSMDKYEYDFTDFERGAQRTFREVVLGETYDNKND